MTKNDIREKVKSILKAELKAKSITYDKLAELLNEGFDMKENGINIKKKISRGNFSAVFMFQCLEVIESKTCKYHK